MDGGGAGRRAALTAPRGLVDALKFADVVPSVGVRKVGSLGGGPEEEEDCVPSGEDEAILEAGRLLLFGRSGDRGATGGVSISAVKEGVT